MLRDCFETGKLVVTVDEAFRPDILEGVDYEKAAVIYHAKKNKGSGGDILLIHLRNKSKRATLYEIERLLAKPHVIFAEANGLYGCHAFPNDPYFRYLWGLEKIKAPEAWQYLTNPVEAVVGVVDSGIDHHHPDIRNNMWASQDGRYGWNFLDDNGDAMDATGHGTHVAGTIGAVVNNFIGIAGVSLHVKIASLKIGNHTFDLASAIAAIDYANQNNIPILNNSWGGHYYSPSLKHAIEQYDGLFVASAGNYGADNDYFFDYPTSYGSDNIISVAASNQNDHLASFSNFGVESVDIAAPGTDILSLAPNGGYDYQKGTSMAAPHVAGAAALLKSYRPDLSAYDIKSIILSSVDKHPHFYGKIRSGGVLNIKAMLERSG